MQPHDLNSNESFHWTRKKRGPVNSTCGNEDNTHGKKKLLRLKIFNKLNQGWNT